MDADADIESTDPSGPSEEDARAFVEQLRATPAEQVIADVLSTLLTAAEVKLGRRDARLFIDLGTAMSEYAGPHLSDGLSTQVEQVLGRLRLAQVSAESQRAENGKAEPNDLSRTPTPPKPATSGASAAAPADPGPAPAPASKLWVPGR